MQQDFQGFDVASVPCEPDPSPWLSSDRTGSFFSFSRWWEKSRLWDARSGLDITLHEPIGVSR